MARELFNTPRIKLEVIAEDDTLQPDIFALVEVTKILVTDGFEIFPYTTDDLVVAHELINAGFELLMPWRPQGLEKLARWKKAIVTTPLEAIGGFTLERVMGAFEQGADTVCVVTDIMQNKDPVARVKQWLSLNSTEH